LLNDLYHFRVGKILDRGGQHNKCAAGKLPDHIHQAGIEILGQHLSGIEMMPVRCKPGPNPGCLGFYTRQHRIDHPRMRGEYPELLPDGRHVRCSNRFRNAARKSYEELDLHGKPDLGLVVLIDMSRRVVELSSAHIRVAINEDTVPWDLDIVEIDERI